MIEDEKDVLVRGAGGGGEGGGCRKSPAFVGYHIFAPASQIERYMEGAILKFHESKKDDPIMTATNLFGEIIKNFLKISLMSLFKINKFCSPLLQATKSHDKLVY